MDCPENQIVFPVDIANQVPCEDWGAAFRRPERLAGKVADGDATFHCVQTFLDALRVVDCGPTGKCRGRPKAKDRWGAGY